MRENLIQKLKAAFGNSGMALITVVAVFAFCSVLAASVTSIVLSSGKRENTRALSGQAYLTAKSVLTATKNHIEKNLHNRTALGALAGKTASGSLPDMGAYAVTVTWRGDDTLMITARGEFKGESAELYATVNVLEEGAPR